ncbi:alkane 1-monooxygenase [Spirosomataceae bacterium TFI 002]|nr:alkane 1-monooxygenase [Spirosomataceae bacterium TFI 002]
MSIFKRFGFLFSYSIPVIILASFYLPSGHWTFAASMYSYLFVSLIDLAIGKDKNNVLKAKFETLVNDRYFDFLVYSHVYIQYFLLLWTAYVLSTETLTTFEIYGLLVSQGVYAGTIINVAHELGHRSSRLAQLHAKAALISVAYIHFIVEHNRGHHVHVATPRDPATSKKNQSLYAFWVQSIVGSFKSAWSIERKLSEKYGYKFLSLQNQIIKGHAITIVLFLSITAASSLLIGKFSLLVLFALCAQAVLAILLLEAVNYVEHYGIVRREISPNKYEKVNPLHSWNANHFYSNLLLFNLQRHSDHHAYAARPYQVLRHFDESPQLPFGYPLMILMATLPPVFIPLMNRKLEVWQENAFDDEHIKKVVAQFA